MKLLQTIRQIRRNLMHYHPSVEVLVSRSALLHNLHQYRKIHPDLLVAPVLKSNAYGHGLIQVASILDNEEIPFFVLDSLYEAMILRHEGIKSPILVIGYTQADNIRHAKLPDIAFTITSLEQLRDVANKVKSQTIIHLKVDTGMHRQGILPRQIPEAIKIIQADRHLCLEGICSHLADTENSDQAFTRTQIKTWQEAVEALRCQFPNIRYFHTLASPGVSFGYQAEGNVARIGKGLYGLDPSPTSPLDLVPVLRVRSLISSVRTLPVGECVGYGMTFKTKRETTVATVPAGYFEGINRRLSNRGCFKIDRHFCPIVGRVSMNITSIDVTDVPGVRLNDEVLLISDNRKDRNCLENIATLADTIPLDILVHIPQHLRRTVVE
jgi:alanine racemase